jgi:hypothetical protein
MSQPETEMSDVYVVLRDVPGLNVDREVETLKILGVQVERIDADNGVIEGSVRTDKLKMLKELPFVEYVRDSFDYIEEDSVDESPDAQDVDDAGA